MREKNRFSRAQPRHATMRLESWAMKNMSYLLPNHLNKEIKKKMLLMPLFLALLWFANWQSTPQLVIGLGHAKISPSMACMQRLLFSKSNFSQPPSLWSSMCIVSLIDVQRLNFPYRHCLQTNHSRRSIDLQRITGSKQTPKKSVKSFAPSTEILNQTTH
jgi:hypothetical protein